MSSTAQKSELQSQIWKIANEARGSVDGWDIKQYILGTLFSNYIEGGNDSINYVGLDDKIITEEINNKVLTSKHIDAIIQLFDSKKEYISKSVDKDKNAEIEVTNYK